MTDFLSTKGAIAIMCCAIIAHMAPLPWPWPDAPDSPFPARPAPYQASGTGRVAGIGIGEIADARRW